MAAWINEFHYDNAGGDTGEFIEIAGTAGTDLTGWQLVRYNGSVPGAAVVYTSPGSITLTGVIANQSDGFGTLSFSLPADGLQNGGNDGFALVDDLGSVVQLLSYEGVFTASGGAANGLTSTDVGVAETNSTPVGASLHLVGDGTAYADFTWAVADDDSPGAVNAGQSFGGTTGTTVSVSDASIAEGDAGTTLLTFTVTRSDNTGAFTLDFATADGTATAGSDYVAASGTLDFAAGGALTQQVSITVSGDTDAEPDETLAVTLSNLVSSLGSAAIADASASGTIINDEVTLTPIWEIQGAGHKAPSVGGAVGSFGNSGAARFNVEGVVTAIAANGFYIQDAVGDGDVATSDGIFVFTSSAPAGTITVGETVRVLNARVDEFRPGSSGGTNNLTITELSTNVSGASVVELGGNTVVAPVVIGADRRPPAGAVNDDGFASFDPATDAIDFWESLEGMLVQLPNPVAISPTARFSANEEIWVKLAGTGDGSADTPAGSPLLGPSDANPERIQLDDLLSSTDLGDVGVGAQLATVTGVVHYDFQNYEVLVPTAPVVVTPSGLAPETTAVVADARELTVASYNVENLDALDAAFKFTAHATQIAFNLGAPVIVALQEVQDDNGPINDGTVSSDQTLQALVDAIFDLSGISYAFAYENPVNNADGGEPGGNIRNAFLYRDDLVSLVGTRRLTDQNPGEADAFAGDDFASSRKPLVGEFLFNGVGITLVNNHFNSKGGDNALFGNVQPPVLTSELQRTEQARIVNAEVNGLLALDPDARIVVLGDLNDFAWSLPNTTLDVSALGSRVLTDLALLLPEDERYSYNFQGNAQELDHTLVTDALLDDGAAAFDIVHVNAEFANQVSDHDPSVALFDFRAFGELLVLGSGDDSVNGERGADTLLGGEGNDALLGSAGDDVLEGGTGIDILRGGAGNDLYRLDDALDLALESAGAGADTVIGSTTLLMRPNIEVGVLEGSADVLLRGNASDNLLFGNDGNNRVFGFGGADDMQGGAGNDTLRGAEGADTLSGGAGRDVMYGEDGTDLFLFDGIPPAANQADVIVDFEAGLDRIGIAAAGFDPTLAAGALDPARFVANVSGQASAAGTGTFVFETDNGRLWWDVDGAGAGRDLVAILRGGVMIGADDILVA